MSKIFNVGDKVIVNSLSTIFHNEIGYIDDIHAHKTFPFSVTFEDGLKCQWSDHQLRLLIIKPQYLNNNE